MCYISKRFGYCEVHFKLEIKIKSLRNSLAVPKSKATKVHRWHMCVYVFDKKNWNSRKKKKRIREKTFGSRKSHRMTKVMTLNEAKVWKKEKLEEEGRWSLKKIPSEKTIFRSRNVITKKKWRSKKIPRGQNDHFLASCLIISHANMCKRVGQQGPWKNFGEKLSIFLASTNCSHEMWRENVHPPPAIWLCFNHDRVS